MGEQESVARDLIDKRKASRFQIRSCKFGKLSAIGSTCVSAAVYSEGWRH